VCDNCYMQPCMCVHMHPHVYVFICLFTHLSVVVQSVITVPLKCAVKSPFKVSNKF
jgi:hypothetical protein